MELIAKNISFKYPSAKKYLLQDVNLELDNKKIIGLIGDSGSGKSTLCKILSGYIPKYEGNVTLETTSKKRIQASSIDLSTSRKGYES